jgi:DNA-binding transcriptional LysR family regulator
MQMASLKVFCDVARFRSFSQAGAANDITQSAVSHIVSQLEHRMDVRLIDRSTRPLQLTAVGQKYYEGCKALLDQYDELEASCKNAQSELAGTVEVAAIYSVGLGDMGECVKTFVEDQPHALVHVEYLHPDRVYDQVRDGTADFGLVSFPQKSAKLIALPWREEEMVVVCAPVHALAGAGVVGVDELEGRKFVHFDRNLVVRRRIDRFLKQHGVSVDVVHEFDSIENIKQAAQVDAGVALLPAPTVRHEVRAGTLVALPLKGVRFVRPLGILLKRGHRLSAAARAFLELLQKKAGPRLNGHERPGRSGPKIISNGASNGDRAVKRGSRAHA